MARYPRLTIDLDVIAEFTRRLAGRLLNDGFALVGVTKAVDGDPEVGREMLEAGCAGLADSRLTSLVRLAEHALAPLTLIRPPQLDEVPDVCAVADRVLLSDLRIAHALSEHAVGAPLDVLLTVDLGDRREGVLPAAVPAVAAQLSRLPGVRLAGISANFACLSGHMPSQPLFLEAERILTSIVDFCDDDPLLSLGGTCVLQYVEGYHPRYATEIRCGGGALFGYDFVSAAPIDGIVRTDPVLTTTVLECYRKPPAPIDRTGYDAFGHVPDVDLPTHDAYYTLLDLGRRDCEPRGLRPLLPNSYVAGATSDITVLITETPLCPGDTVSFALDYDALVRAAASPFVSCEFVHGTDDPHADLPSPTNSN
ncbi:MAG: alanine racemase [Thermoleophilia bacterium]